VVTLNVIARRGYSCWHQNWTHLKTVQTQKMYLSLLMMKKKALLISMYLYAIMLTCHRTQSKCLSANVWLINF
jgi:hypothetical protein